MSSLVKIVFNENPAGVYFAGQNVSGKVQITTHRVKTIRAICLKLHGFSKVEWEETTGTGESETKDTYIAKEDYFEVNKTIMKKENGDSFDLQPGEHEFDFEITLPTSAPSSFSGCYGEVKYIIICTIDRPWKFNNVFKQPFTVIYPIDLNMHPTYLIPVERETSKSFSGFLFLGNGGTISVKVSSPCGAYVPGQSIPISLYIKNHSDVSTYETNACLVQTIDYRAETPYKKSKYEYRLVTIHYFGPLEKSQEKKFQCNLYIPSVAPSSISSCKIIEALYNVEIQLKTRGLHRSMQVKLPVTIGTIPYGCKSPLNILNASSSSKEASNSTDKNQRLPSYEEAVALGPTFSKETEEDKHIKKVEYAPKYPLYNNITLPTLPLEAYKDSS